MEALCRWITKRAASPRVTERLSESDDYTVGYVDGLTEVLSVLTDLTEDYKLRMVDHDDE